MTDPNDQATGEAPAAEPAAEPAADSASTGTAESTKAREWVGQLQAMIDDLATQAAPTIRQVGAKAAELAAVAGERAGPFAQRAAEITGEAGLKLAERSRHLAEELRREMPGAEGATEGVAEAGDVTPEPAVRTEAEPAPSDEAPTA